MLKIRSLTTAVALATSFFGGSVFADSMSAPEGYKPDQTKVRINADPVTGNGVLIIKDLDAWDSPANEQILGGLGIGYDVVNATGMDAVVLSNYCLVIVASDQPQSFYDVFQANLGKFEQFVLNGGVLQFNGADMGWQSGSWGTLPGGTTHMNYSDGTNHVVDAAHPIVAGVSPTFTGSSASHGNFDNYPASATVVTTDTSGGATTVVYPLGSGTVIASGITLEHGYANGYEAGTVLQNTIPWAYSQCGGGNPATPIDGKVRGAKLAYNGVTCTNLTTGQRVRGRPLNGSQWSCARLGLNASPTDKVRIELTGSAQ